MNILLHICCAPCSIYPIEELRKEGHKIAGYFYNPNIHPYSEYLKRKQEVDKYCTEEGINVTYDDYELEEYFHYVVYNEALKIRCPVCWWLRVQRTAKLAKECGFDAFTMTLLGSPYQDHDVLKNICEDVANKVGVKFYYKDFRPGFKDARDRARAKGIYLQSYCGCIYSEKERIEKKGQGPEGRGQEK